MKNSHFNPKLVNLGFFEISLVIGGRCCCVCNDWYLVTTGYIHVDNAFQCLEFCTKERKIEHTSDTNFGGMKRCNQNCIHGVQSEYEYWLDRKKFLKI